jgi:hypothetical protein
MKARGSTRSEWEIIYEDSRRDRRLFKAVCWLLGAVLLGILMLNIHDGQLVTTAVIVTLASFGLVTITRSWYEADRSVRHWLQVCGRMFRLHEQSWGFLAQTLVLGPALVIAARTWPTLPRGQWYDQWYWMPAALAAGLVFATVLRLLEQRSYDVLRMESHDKIVHDLVATFVVIGGLIYGGVPVVAVDGPGAVLWLTVAWVVIGQMDLIRTRLKPGTPWRLDRSKLHFQAGANGRPVGQELMGVPMASDY